MAEYSDQSQTLCVGCSVLFSYSVKKKQHKQQQLLQQLDVQQHQKVSLEQNIEPLQQCVCLCVCVYHRNSWI